MISENYLTVIIVLSPSTVPILNNKMKFQQNNVFYYISLRTLQPSCYNQIMKVNFLWNFFSAWCQSEEHRFEDHLGIIWSIFCVYYYVKFNLQIHSFFNMRFHFSNFQQVKLNSSEVKRKKNLLPKIC